MVDKKAVLLQGEPRDATLNFDPCHNFVSFVIIDRKRCDRENSVCDVLLGS